VYNKKITENFHRFWPSTGRQRNGRQSKPSTVFCISNVYFGVGY